MCNRLVKSSDSKKIWKDNIDIELQTTFSTHKDLISCIFFANNESKIVSVGHDCKLKVFSLPLNRQIRSANIGCMPLSSCVQLPNLNVLVIGSYDNTMYVELLV